MEVTSFNGPWEVYDYLVARGPRYAVECRPPGRDRPQVRHGVRIEAPRGDGTIWLFGDDLRELLRTALGYAEREIRLVYEEYSEDDFALLRLAGWTVREIGRGEWNVVNFPVDEFTIDWTLLPEVIDPHEATPSQAEEAFWRTVENAFLGGYDFLGTETYDLADRASVLTLARYLQDATDEAGVARVLPRERLLCLALNI